jgi:hypothetical protein
MSLLYSLFWFTFRRLSLCADVSELCSIFIGGVSRKNNWDKIVGVLIQEKVLLNNSLSQSEEWAMERGRVQVEKQVVEGKDPKWRPIACLLGRNGAAYTAYEYGTGKVFRNVSV